MNAPPFGLPPIVDFFRDACRRAGYEPRFRNMWFSRGRGPWEVRPI
jgi:hypothetical protein